MNTRLNFSRGGTLKPLPIPCATEQSKALKKCWIAMTTPAATPIQHAYPENQGLKRIMIFIKTPECTKYLKKIKPEQI